MVPEGAEIEVPYLAPYIRWLLLLLLTWHLAARALSLSFPLSLHSLPDLSSVSLPHPSPHTGRILVALN